MPYFLTNNRIPKKLARFSIILCCWITPAFATSVTVSTPANGSTISGAVSVQASASSTNPIDGWHIYDNSNDVYHVSGISSINASLSLAAGSHTLVIRAWDNTGTYGDQTVNITVSSGGTPPPSCGSTPSVTLTTPTNGSTVTAPVPVQASACAANPIAGWIVYDNSQSVYSANGVSSISTSLNLSSGSHTLIARAWDNTGAFGDKTVTISVGQGGNPPPSCGGSTPTVTLTKPTTGTTVGDPVAVQASACGANPIAGWIVYDNGQNVYSANSVSSISTSLNLSSGSHTLIARAWDNTGNFGDKTATITVGQTPSSGGVPASNHVYVVVLENHSYSDVIGSSLMPNLNRMANNYGLATNYFADTHPSIGNYFEMTAGQIITNDDSFSSTVSADNIVRHLLSAGKTWKEYSESIPNVGYTGGDFGTYLQHHNPLSYFSDVRGTAQANNLVPFSQLQADINGGSLPNFGFIVPNSCDDAHDCGLDTADTWLQNKLFNTLLQAPPFQSGGDGLLIVVFDEADSSDSTNGGGYVAAVLIGPKVKNGFQSTTFYQHESLLRTVNDALGLSNFGDATSAPNMGEFFK